MTVCLLGCYVRYIILVRLRVTYKRQVVSRTRVVVGLDQYRENRVVARAGSCRGFD